MRRDYRLLIQCYFMIKSKISNFSISIFLTTIFFFVGTSVSQAVSTDSVLPDNVKVTSSADGSSTTVILSSKPGYSTTVQTSCINGKCIHTATSTPFTSSDAKKMRANIKKQQEAMNKFWKMQDDLIKQQQKMFQDFWKTGWF